MEHSITEWVSALKAGDEQAAAALWQRYFHRLVGLARSRMKNLSRRIVDEEEVALSVFRRFCAAAHDGQFQKMVDRDDLWQLLAKITVHRVIDHQRRSSAQKQGGGEVRGESVFGAGDDGSVVRGIDQHVDANPGPDELAALSEEFEHLLTALNDDTLRQVALWKMEGYTNEEIAATMQLTTRSIERKLKRIRDIWSVMEP